MARAQLDHARNIVRARLRPRIEDCVAAAHISFYRVLRPDSIAQLQIDVEIGAADVHAGALQRTPHRRSRIHLGGESIDINTIYPAELFESQNAPFASESTEPSPVGSGVGSSEKKKPRAGSGDSTEKSSPEDYELLGDLHLKQGQGLEALRAYQQALAKSPDAQHAAAMYLKLAQLYLTVQKDEAEARQAMEHARELLAQAAPAAEKLASKPTPSAELAQPLPSRLIISAPKRLLDQVSAGKMTLEDFKKKATVERLSFGAPQK